MTNETLQTVWRIWLSGGWVMLPLFGLALLLYGQSLHLILHMRRQRIDGATQKSWREWVRKPETAEGRIGDIVRYTQDGATDLEHVRHRFAEIRLALLATVERRTAFLGTLVAAAPLLGLLGTVMGMLQTFFGISTSGGSETAGVVASGISEALVTTQTGLMVALPGLFLVMIINRKRQAIDATLTRLESLTLSQVRFEPDSSGALGLDRAA
ncbi:MAG: MotA/TolQ/ExbB proton channel family protein [Myxococcota bacterium]